MALIQWHYLYPFTEARRCIGLAFAYDPDLVAYLKDLNYEFRPLVQTDNPRRQALGWLSDLRLWFVDEAVWSRVQACLQVRGHVLLRDNGKDEQRQPPPTANNPPQFDPYAILGVPRTATPDEIRRAYLGAIKILHPDVNPASADAEVGALLTQRSADLNRAFQQIEQEQRNRGAFR